MYMNGVERTVSFVLYNVFGLFLYFAFWESGIRGHFLSMPTASLLVYINNNKRIKLNHPRLSCPKLSCCRLSVFLEHKKTLHIIRDGVRNVQVQHKYPVTGK